MRRALIFLVALGLVLVSFGQRVHVEKPWILAYNEEGDLLWEIHAGSLEGEGPERVARDVVVTLYRAGEPAVTIRIESITSGPKGLKWRSSGKVEGEGNDLRFSAQEVIWEEGRLVLRQLSFTSGRLSLEAVMVVWKEGIWELIDVSASYGEWELEFSKGAYDQGARVLRVEGTLSARGWGWEVWAEGAEVDLDTEKVILRGVRVVEA